MTSKQRSARAPVGAARVLIAAAALSAGCTDPFVDLDQLPPKMTDSSGQGSEGEMSTAGTTDTTGGDPDTTGGSDPETGTSPPDLPQEDAPPQILSLTANQLSPVLVVNDPVLVDVEVHAADDLGLDELHMSLAGEPWHSFELDGELDVVRNVDLPIASPKLNEESPLVIQAWADDGAQSSPIAEVEIHVNLAADPSPEPLWEHEYAHDGPPPAASEFLDVDTDEAGEVYAVGYWIDGADPSARLAMFEHISADGENVCTNSSFLGDILAPEAEAHGVAHAHDGSLIVVGGTDGGPITKLWARRLTPDCELDDSWKITYAATYQGEEVDTWALDVAIDDEDNIYVAGFARTADESSSWPVILKFHPDFETPVATYKSEESPMLLKYHMAWDITHDPIHDVILVAGAKSSDAKLFDQRMMLLALQPSLGKPIADIRFDEGDEFVKQHSEGFGVRIRADETILVSGLASIDDNEPTRARVWEYALDLEENPDNTSFHLLDHHDLTDYGMGQERAVAIDVSPEIPNTGSSEYAVAGFTDYLFGPASIRGFAAKFSTNGEFAWDDLLDLTSRDQSVAISEVGYVHVAGYWKVDPELSARGVVRKLAP